MSLDKGFQPSEKIEFLVTLCELRNVINEDGNKIVIIPIAHCQRYFGNCRVIHSNKEQTMVHFVNSVINKYKLYFLMQEYYSNKIAFKQKYLQ